VDAIGRARFLGTIALRARSTKKTREAAGAGMKP